MKKEIASKLRIRKGESVLVLNSPKGFLTSSDTADVKPKAGRAYDLILAFVTRSADVEPLLKKIAKNHTGRLWIAYPKKNGSIKTDLSRDQGWSVLTAKGLDVVSLMAIDEDWSALRFKPASAAPAKPMAPTSSGRKQFEGLIEQAVEGMDAAYVTIPFSVEKEYGTRGQVKVKAWFDGHAYRGVLANMGTGMHVIGLRKDIRQAIGKTIGDRVSVILEKDTEERIVDVPDDLKKAFTKSRDAAKFFESLSYTNRKEYAVWISSAKKPETREKRLADTIQKLLAGKRNPSEK